MNHSEIEQRENPRFVCANPKDCFVNFRDQKQSGSLFNLSRKGLAFQTSRQLQKDEVHELKIHAPAFKQPITCEARIVWVRPGPREQYAICGARILRMDPALKMDLLEIFYQDWKKT